MDPGHLLQAALEAARRADPVIRRYWEKGAAARLKADRTPVTEADVGAERAIRDFLAERFPDHGFHGEETGQAEGSGVTWLVDPIDGTRAFVRGYPFFSTQIAAMADGELVAGVSHAPLFGATPQGETAAAAAGHGARLAGHEARVSSTEALSEAHVSVGNLATLAAGPRWAVLAELAQRTARLRGYGDFLQYHLLAAGRIDAVIESDVNILDIAALAVIVREAGGVFTDLEGRPVGPDTRSVLAANPRLHKRLLAMFEAAGA